MKRLSLLLNFLFVMHLGTFAQEVVEVAFLSTITKNNIQFLLTFAGINANAENDIALYKLNYTTTGSDGLKDTASGLMLLPLVENATFPTMIYQHGTTSGRSDVPSNLRGGYEIGALFAALGMVVVAPDYLGMGDSRGFHPYVHAETEASAAIDMLKATKSYLEAEQIKTSEQLFLTGYSQGGHAAMAVHKVLERDYADQYEVTASLPMSGPYSISNVMRGLAFTDNEYFFPSYLVYSTRGFQEVYGDLYESIDDVFKEVFMPVITPFVTTGEGLFSLNESIVRISREQFGRAVPKNIFKSEVLNLIESDPMHPFNVAVRLSDVDQWRPKAPVLMLYCKSDDQVPFTNSTRTDSIMNALGAEEVMSMDVSDGRNLTHSDCIQPALNKGVPWILSFIDKPTSTIELTNDLGIPVPNPANDYFVIHGAKAMHDVQIFNRSGVLVQSVFGVNEGQRIDISHLSSDQYYVTLRISDKYSVVKLMIVR